MIDQSKDRELDFINVYLEYLTIDSSKTPERLDLFSMLNLKAFNMVYSYVLQNPFNDFKASEKSHNKSYEFYKLLIKKFEIEATIADKINPKMLLVLLHYYKNRDAEKLEPFVNNILKTISNHDNESIIKFTIHDFYSQYMPSV